MPNRVRNHAAFTLDPEVIKRLADVSQSTMIPRSRLVERAITEYLDRRTQQPRDDARGEG